MQLHHHTTAVRAAWLILNGFDDADETVLPGGYRRGVRLTTAASPPAGDGAGAVVTIDLAVEAVHPYELELDGWPRREFLVPLGRIRGLVPGREAVSAIPG